MAKGDLVDEGGVEEIIEEIVKDDDEVLILPSLSLNHVSFTCKSVSRSVKFYEQVLGLVLIRRPSSFDFQGAWLFNHGIGIHLLELDPNVTPPNKPTINPKDNHISFQCSDMDLIMKKLKQLSIKYVTAAVKEGGVEVNQLFFHDPDGYMIEICNCHVLPVLPISSCPLSTQMINLSASRSYSNDCKLVNGGSIAEKMEDEAVMMMDNLLVDMIGISF